MSETGWCLRTTRSVSSLWFTTPDRIYAVRYATTRQTFFLFAKSWMCPSSLVTPFTPISALQPNRVLLTDHHHDALNPSPISPSEIIARTNAIFRRRGIRPKQHVSESRPGAETLMERRAHSDRVETLPDVGDEDMGASNLEFPTFSVLMLSFCHPFLQI
jgi:hypothetical protein